MIGVEEASFIGISMILFSIGMAHMFYHSCRSKRRTVLAWLIVVVVSVTLGQLLTPLLGNCAGQYSGFIAIFVYLYLFTDISVSQRLFTYFFVDSSMYITVLAARYTALFFWSDGIWMVQRVMFVLLYIVFTVTYLTIFFRYLKKPMVELLKISQENVPVMTIFATLGYVMLLLLFDAWEIRTAVSAGLYFRMLCFMALLSCGYYIAFRTIAFQGARVHAENVLVQVSDQLRMTEQYYESVLNCSLEIRRVHHDMKHHLRVLSSLYAAGDDKALGEYLSELSDAIPSAAQRQWCRNLEANILLDRCAMEARSKGILFTCTAEIPAECMKNRVDLCVILGNGLQNALEASQRLPMGEQGEISVLAHMEQGNLLIELSNRFDGTIRKQEGRLQTMKEEAGHGIGLESIRITLERYQGYMDTIYTDHYFTLRILIPTEMGTSKGLWL